MSRETANLRKVAITYRQRVDSYRGRRDRYGKLVVRCAKRCGDALRAIKEREGHSKFTYWIESQFGASPQTARGYMRLSENWDLIESRVKSGDVASIRAALKLCRKQPDDEPAPEGYINRRRLLAQLKSVEPGTHSKDLVEQSSCFAFKDGRVHTYNDEIACSSPTEIKVEGVVPAAPLLNILRQIDSLFVQIEAENGNLVIKSGRSRATIKMEEEIRLPFDALGTPKRWKPLPPNFADVLAQVVTYCGSDRSRFALTCVHFTPDMVEACDNYQATRYAIELPISRECLIQVDSLKAAIPHHTTEMGRTDRGLHFRTAEGATIAFRIHTDEYPNLNRLYEVEGNPITFPRELARAAERANVFSAQIADANRVAVTIKPRKVILKGEGDLGAYRESIPIEYEGPSFQFLIHPALLVDIANHGKECRITENRLWIVDGAMTYVACLENWVKDAGNEPVAA